MIGPQLRATLSGVAVVCGDSHPIIPKRFLKSAERTGLARALLAHWRFRADGAEEPGFVLHLARYRGATALVAGHTFGCGSSREHLQWVLRAYGIGAIVAPSFADIFRANRVGHGLVTAEAPEQGVRCLMGMVETHEGLGAMVELLARTVQGEGAAPFAVVFADASRRRLLKDADAIAMTLAREAAISHCEAVRAGSCGGGARRRRRHRPLRSRPPPNAQASRRGGRHPARIAAPAPPASGRLAGASRTTGAVRSHARQRAR